MILMEILSITLLLAGVTSTRCIKQYSVAVLRREEKLVKLLNLQTVLCHDPLYCACDTLGVIIKILEKSKLSYDLVEISEIALEELIKDISKKYGWEVKLKNRVAIKNGKRIEVEETVYTWVRNHLGHTNDLTNMDEII
jgi:hypothetical protein